MQCIKYTKWNVYIKYVVCYGMNTWCHLFWCPRDRGHIVFGLLCHSVILLFCPALYNLNLANNVWTMSAKALIFPLIRPSADTIIFYPVTLTLDFDQFFENFNLANNFCFKQWVLEIWYSTWIFPVIRPFRGYHYFSPCDLYLGVWPFFETLTLLITFEQWVLEIWYFTWIFPVKRHFRGYDNFFLATLILESEQFFLKT